MRWNNTPVAFAEAKNGIGYNRLGETTLGGFTLERTEEPFEVMMGVPETELLYFNAGATEGHMDVSYTFYHVEFNMLLTWYEEFICELTGDIRSGTYWREHRFDVKFLALDDAGYSVADYASILNPVLLRDGGFDIYPTTDIPHAFELQGNLENDSEPWYGNDITKYNYGTTENWEQLFTAVHPDFIWAGVEDCVWDPTDNPRHEELAQELWREYVGEVFAQNDALVISIGSMDYPFSKNGANYQTMELDGKRPWESFPTELFASEDIDDFNPYGDEWCALESVAVSGYKGFDLEGSARNMWFGITPQYSVGTGFWISEHRAMTRRLVNGVYSFEPWEFSNVMNYKNQQPIKGDYQGLQTTPDWIGLAHLPKMVTDESRNVISQTEVVLQYMAWQTAWGDMQGSPSYYSLNPIIIHNPIGNLFAWVHDTPEYILEDQRIVLLGQEEDSSLYGNIIRHPWTVDSNNPPARLYIDFDFKVSIPNHATLQSYAQPNSHWGWGYLEDDLWGSTHVEKDADWGLAGVVDIDSAEPGLRGKGYEGSMQFRWSQRSDQNPHNLAQAWDVSKWINAKFVKFPFDVYYYGTVKPEEGDIPNGSTHYWGMHAYPGGSISGFYPAGTWILLYDNQFEVSDWDPTDFWFRVASHTLDNDSSVIQFLTEAINLNSHNIRYLKPKKS